VHSAGFLGNFAKRIKVFAADSSLTGPAFNIHSWLILPAIKDIFIACPGKAGRAVCQIDKMMMSK
jgi:hypothetical protein